MNIALSSESTLDLQKDQIEKFNIHVVPFTILLGEELHLDQDGIGQKIFDYVKETKVLPMTSAINQAQFEEHFDKLLETHDYVLHLSTSSKISSACSNAIEASKKYGGKVVVVDTLSLSTGIALLCMYARTLIDSGLEIDEITEKVVKRIPFVQVSLVVDNLNYLHKGGRCSALQLLGSNILKIKPEMVLVNGSLVLVKKIFGLFTSTIKTYCEDILKRYDNPDKKNVFISYTTADEKDVEYLKARLKEFGFQNIYTSIANGTISSHSGPHSLGIIYINDGGENI